VEWQIMEGTYENSLQNQFDEVKEAWGINTDIKFYTTEFNFKKRLVTEDEAARGFLTAVWDALGVVGNRGQGVTQFALPWNIFHTTSQDDHYGICTQLDPWTPTARGRVLQMICQLSEGMEFILRDPGGRGEYILNGNDKKMWVWQNRTEWTNHPGTAYEVEGIPDAATKLEVYGWDGLRRSLDLSGQVSYTVDGLANEETYMFLVNAVDSNPVSIQYPLSPDVFNYSLDEPDKLFSGNSRGFYNIEVIDLQGRRVCNIPAASQNLYMDCYRSTGNYIGRGIYIMRLIDSRTSAPVSVANPYFMPLRHQDTKETND